MASRLHQISSEIGDIVIGVLRGVRGVQGELRIDVLTDVPERFQPGRFVSIKGLKRKITKFTMSSKGGLLHLEGVSSRNVAEALVGETVYVSNSEAVMNPDGAYFHHQLIGMCVINGYREPLGILSEIISTGSNDVYVVSQEGHKDILVPAISNVIQSVDVLNNKMLVNLPKGLDL